jgi:type II secretory pathway component PulK
MKGRKSKEIKRVPNPFTFHSSPFTSEKGIALMMVLWVLVLLSIIALNYFGSNRWNSASTRNLKEETLAYAMAMSGYQEAVNYVMSDKDPAIDFIDNEGQFWTDTDEKTQPVTGLTTTEDGEVEIKISDENAKININTPDTNLLRSLFLYVGIPDDEITELLDCIVDWKDSGDRDAKMASGAESDYYEELSDPYKAKNGTFTVPEELALVKGMKPEYFKAVKEGEEEKALLPLITAFGGNTLNINTVSQEVMQILGLTDSEIEMIMKQRTKEMGGWRSIPQLSVKGLNAMATQNFRIEVVARTKNSNLGIKIVAVLNRKPALEIGGYKIQTLYWREDAENIRG